MKNRIDRRLDRIITMAEFYIGHGSASSTPSVECIINSVEIGRYFLVFIKRDDGNLILEEMISRDSGSNIIYRNWTFKKETRWEIVSLEKKQKQVFLDDLQDEMQDLLDRISYIHRLGNNSAFYYDDEVINAPEKMRIEYDGTQSFKLSHIREKRRFQLLAAAGIFTVLSIVGALAFSASFRFRQIHKIQNQVEESISEYKTATDEQFSSIGDFMDNTEGALSNLQVSLDNKQQDFEITRRQAYINVLRLAEELTQYLPARKEAYRLIASNIMESATYGEIIYEMSRLPSAEYQARILLASDKQKVVPLSRYLTPFSVFLYPVQIAGMGNDGRGFRISSGYMDKREDPFGTGGIKPHFAVDIVNVSNISFINYAGEIIRDGMPPGDIIAVSDGIVTDIAFDDSYGWNMEIEHSLTDEILKQYPEATSWRTFYAHMVESPELKIGDFVLKGRTLGYIGSTGKSTGPHLHFEVRVYHDNGLYWGRDGGRFDKVNPFPFEKPSSSLPFSQ